MMFQLFYNKKQLVSRQCGVVLVISLIMLLAMTLIGVTLSTSSVLQERLASNTRQQSLARINAESALRVAETRLEALFGTAANVFPEVASQFNATQGDELLVAINTNGITLDALPASFDVTDADSWAAMPALSRATAAAGVLAGGQAQTPPRYMIEYIGLLLLNQPNSDIDINAEASETISQVPHAFRVTAVGYGQNSRIYSVLQSIYSTDK